jgi:hypothetical protein
MNSKTAMRASAWGLEATPIKQLAFERGEEARRHRVIVGVSDRTHRGAHARLPTSFAEFDRGVLGGFNRSAQHWFHIDLGGTGRKLRQVSSSQAFCGASRL